MADHASEHSGGRKLRCVIVTPEETVLDCAADFVALPLYDGELGVAVGHAPMIGRLGYGELRIGREGQRRRYYVEGGFVQIADDVVSVLTGKAAPAAKLDLATIEASLESALSAKAAGDEQLSLRAKEVAQARAQLRVAKKS
jgi:F-type H+-transporting ATPase subunit epsilon